MIKRIALVLTAAMTLPILCSRATAQPCVAVLVEPGMISYLGTPALNPSGISATLMRYGIPSEGVTVDKVVSGGLTVKNYPVLVLPYGNAFPLSAFSALRAYHASGGCLIMSGVPFTHPEALTNGVWTDLGHDPHFQDNDQGIGTGGFLASSDGPLEISPGNPLGLSGTETPLPLTNGNLQCLVTTDFPASDLVIPLVEHVNASNGAHQLASALIVHKNDPFDGAIDVWIGTLAGDLQDTDAFFATQLMVRGAAYCLMQKGVITSTRAAAIMATAAQAPHPLPYPHNLVFKTIPRPGENTFLPKSPIPNRQLLVVANIAALTSDERKALWSLQGLTSRSRPRIWLTTIDDPAKDFALQTMKDSGAIDGYTIVSDWKSLFATFSTAYKGAVVYDPEFYCDDTLAANVAGAQDLIATSAAVAEELHIPVKLDLRGRFTSYADGLQWVWKTYHDKLNHRLCEIAPDIAAETAYSIQWRGVAFWISGPIDGQLPGADLLRERRTVAGILSQMEPNTPCIGYPYAGDGIGIGEGDGVKLLSQYAIPLIASDRYENLPVLSGVRIDRLVQKPQPPVPLLDKSKIYIALAMSDGDNMNDWRWMHENFFEQPRYGDFPLAFGIGPTILDLQPSVAQWYYQHAAPNTEFFSDVSGIAYMQPENYGTSFQHPDQVLRGFLDWTRDYMSRLDLKTVRPVEGDDQLLEQYAAILPRIDSLLADMGRVNINGIQNLTYTLPNGLPVFRAVTGWTYGDSGLLREVREQVGAQRPAFVNGFVHVWTFDMGSLVRTYDQRDADMVFVTPAQLAALYKEAAAWKPVAVR